MNSPSRQVSSTENETSLCLESFVEFLPIISLKSLTIPTTSIRKKKQTTKMMMKTTRTTHKKKTTNMQITSTFWDQTNTNFFGISVGRHLELEEKQKTKLLVFLCLGPYTIFMVGERRYRFLRRHPYTRRRDGESHHTFLFLLPHSLCMAI